mgnify:FL=1
MSDEPLRVTVGSDGRVEVAGCGLVLALEPDDGQVSVLVFGGDVLLGHLRLARDGVEVAQAGEWRLTLVEWPR